MTYRTCKKALSLLVVLAFISTAVAASQSIDNSNDPNDINQVDADGKRQGFWRISGPVKNKPEYPEGKIYEEGQYVDSKKTGVWKRFWPNGNMLSEIEYKQNRPMGAYKIFQKDGSIEEHGNWEYNTNTGNFKRYHENGKVAQDFKFNENGTRNGEQKYYHENGELAVSVEIKNGKEQGTMKRYYENGDVKAEVVYNDGKADMSKSKWVESKNELPTAKTTSTKSAPKANSEDKVNEAVHFKHNGNNTLYNKDRMVTQTGEFKNGKLYNGKMYKRTKNGVLYKIEMYREGIYIGEGIIGPDDY